MDNYSKTIDKSDYNRCTARYSSQNVFIKNCKIDAPIFAKARPIYFHAFSYLSKPCSKSKLFIVPLSGAHSILMLRARSISLGSAEFGADSVSPATLFSKGVDHIDIVEAPEEDAGGGI